jgi:hypothetical protein
MRDIKRIDPFLNQVAKLWKLHPDLRFYQIISLIGDIRENFYTEEPDILKLIENLIIGNDK